MARDYTIDQSITLNEDGTAKRKDSANIVTVVTENTEQDIIIDENTVDLAIAFGGVVNGLLLIVETDQLLTAKINGGTTAIPVSKFLMITGTFASPITQLEISNPSVDTKANVRITIGG